MLIVIFEISTLEFYKMQSFMQHKKLYVWEQNCFISVFLGCNCKKLLSYLKLRPSNCRVSSKTRKLGTKNAFFGCFKVKIKKKLLSYLKSAAQNFQNFKFRTKIVLFEYFWTGIWKNYCHAWSQHPRVYLKWLFNHYSEGSAFSEGPGQGSLYKVCHKFWNHFIFMFFVFSWI